MASLLYLAAQSGNIDDVRTLIALEDKYRGVADEAFYPGGTPMCVAAQMGRCAVVRALVDAGRDMESGADNGATPIDIGSSDGWRTNDGDAIRVGALAMMITANDHLMSSACQGRRHAT